jgi:aryl-alcohol dehydrogenase-like predicted oxidoreductase
MRSSKPDDSKAIRQMPFENPLFEFLPQEALPLGLGCSRLGSVNGATDDESRALLKLALDKGIQFFDTSNIYGQGDSERLLGEVVGRRDGCLICSKAGKHLSWKKRTLTPLKGVLRAVTRRSSQTRRGVAAARAKPMPTRWDAPFLLASIDGSLRRLKRPQIDLFMLHSPSRDVVARGEAVGALETARDAGKIGVIGVSVDDVATAEAALRDSRVRALQLPMRPGENDFDAVVQSAMQGGVAVIAREIFGGAKTMEKAVDPASFAWARAVEMIQMPGVTLPLIGTTSGANLTASIEAAREAMRTAV